MCFFVTKNLDEEMRPIKGKNKIFELIGKKLYLSHLKCTSGDLNQLIEYKSCDVSLGQFVKII